MAQAISKQQQVLRHIELHALVGTTVITYITPFPPARMKKKIFNQTTSIRHYYTETANYGFSKIRHAEVKTQQQVAPAIGQCK
ncbi:hypothetical protein EC973_004259 [Apophysomyces ossiformis]|uniref:Uncharacterized protein n=1 Tax=Apophysomyces ossiformis TaxID=679940 RepID=A0A8H7BII4_9FUNG|nr:hypothetical protein EC973_004259 [Apophysomyces ossiformis]